MFRTDDENREHNARMTNPEAAWVAREKYAWPGGYELFAVTDDGGVLCHGCCKKEYWQIVQSISSDGWYVTGIGCAASEDGPVFCDHCQRNIVECWQCENPDCHGCD